jgi:hypothetical protein
MEIETTDSPSDDVRAAIAQLQNPDIARDVKPEPAEPETDLTAEPESNDDSRARDPDTGRFVKAPAQAAADPPKSSKTPPTEPALTEQKQLAGGPPARLSKEAKAVWDSVHPSIQAEWAKLEADTAKGVEKLKTEHQTALQRFQDIEGTIAPRREHLRSLGFQTDGQALQHLFSFSDSYQRDPTGTVAHLALQPGVDRNRLFAMLSGAPAQQQPQPQFQQHQPQPDYRAAIREEIGLANAASEIEAFASDSSHPHFQAARPLMSHLLQSGQAATLEEAYEAAVWANPALRQERMEAAAAEKAAKDQAAQRAQLEAKKRASNASLSGAPHGASPGAPRRNGKAPSNAFEDAAEDVRAAIAQLS